MENVQVLFAGNNLLTFSMVCVALMGLYVLIGNAIKIHREIHKPSEQRETDLKTRVKSLEKATSEHTEEINDLHEGVRVQCQAVMALLNHAIHNGNTDEMAAASQRLNTYLSKKM